MAILPVGIGPVTGGYQIERSLRFNSADSAYLSRTMGTPTNANVGSISFWVKRSKLSTTMAIFGTNGTYATCNFNSDDTLSVQVDTSGSPPYKATTAVYRDPSAWMHILYTWDTSNTQNGTPPQQAFYVNGVAITSWSTNQEGTRNLASPAWTTSGKVFYIGYSSNANAYFDGYIAEFYLIDGQEKAYTDFVETDSATGILKPKAYTGTYGANGAYLNFSDNSGTTSTTLGKDYSGNGNNWTPNLFSVTAGVGNDSLVDTPTNYGTDTGAGGEVRGNYCTWNPLDSSGNTLANGNLQVTEAGSSYNQTLTTQVIDYKTYAEFTLATLSGQIGVQSGARSDSGGGGFSGMTIGYNTTTSGSYAAGEVNTAGSASGTTYTAPSTNDVFMIAVDPSNGKVWMGLQGTWFNSGNPAAGTGEVGTISTSNILRFAFGRLAAGGGVVYANFGQRPFAYTAPSGFKALCTQNLPTPTIGATSTTQANDYFNTVLYTGTGSSLSVTGVGFQPDFVWIKERAGAADHGLYDAVRGVQKQLESNNTDAETTETTGLTAFGTDGFTVGALAQLNTNTDTYVAWNWKANGAGSSNTAGTITSTVSVNTTSGFSIVIYNSGASGNKTVGHGLGVKPAMIITKSRTSASFNWSVYHTSIATTVNKYLQLNTTAATSDNGSSIWGASLSDTNSTTFGINSGNGVVASTDCIAYCFAPVAGYSAFGSYSGNNSSTDGPFVYLGFRPRFIMIKSTSASTEWVMVDSARSTYNLVDTSLYANRDYSESTIGTVNDIDFLSNGFKLRNNTGYVNASQTYVYAAFAESPFKYALAR